MIFVTLGTQKFQLNRLLTVLDEYVERGLIKDEIIAQVGNSDYVPKGYKTYPFLDKAEFDQYIQKSSLVITHSGVGSIISALQYKKPVIVYPRLKKYNEHVDDHQLDIAQAFAKKGYILCCNEQDHLMTLIEQSTTMQFEEYVSQREAIVQMIDMFLNEHTQFTRYSSKEVSRDVN